MSASGLTFGRYVLGAGMAIALLFTLVAPSASAGFGPLGRLLYWTLHTFAALAALSLAQDRIARAPAWRRRPWLATLIAGVLGAWLFAPAALGLEQVLGLVPEPDGDPLDAWALRWGLAGSLVAEALELTVPVTATWLLLNAPWLLQLDFRPAVAPMGEAGEVSSLRDPEVVGQAASVAPSPELSAPPPPSPEPPATTGPPPSPESKGPEPAALSTEPASTEARDPSKADGLLEQLPVALGGDLIAMTSQLHYLEVHTARGRTLVLYNLRDAVAEVEAQFGGLQIHRSHWVADAHVRRLTRRSGGWICELSNGLELPVSRRRAADAKRRWGAGATYRPADA
ncbi:MAG: LytTR family DNA-binding domain-containing protein [Acidobacteriota bacterium]